MKAKTLNELPAQATCKKCGQTKDLADMVVVRRKRENVYALRSRCKECQNAYNRRFREWRREYLRKWRKKNRELNRSYWDNPEAKSRQKEASSRFFKRNHEALLIRNRLLRRGQSCTLAEAKEYLAKYGPNYPTIHGLTATGKKEVERIRSTYRRMGKKITALEIRLMVYEDGLEDLQFLKKPSTQKFPYKNAARKLRNWHQQQKEKI